eukprot:scaffold2190_cov118-Isochrysis_galbana.AAC.2
MASHTYTAVAGVARPPTDLNGGKGEGSQGAHPRGQRMPLPSREGDVAPALRAPAARAAQRCDVSAPVRVARSQDEEQPRMRGAEGGVRLERCLLLPLMCARRQPHLTSTADRLSQSAELRGIRRSGAPHLLQVSHAHGRPRAQVSQHVGHRRRLRQRHVEAAQQQLESREHRRRLRPPTRRGGRKSSVEQSRRDACVCRLAQHGWPELALDEHQGGRPPHAQQPADDGRCVHRPRAECHARTEVLQCQPAERRLGAGGDEHACGRVAPQQGSHHWQGGEGLAHRRRMHPQHEALPHEALPGQGVCFECLQRFDRRPQRLASAPRHIAQRERLEHRARPPRSQRSACRQKRGAHLRQGLVQVQEHRRPGRGGATPVQGAGRSARVGYSPQPRFHVRIESCLPKRRPCQKHLRHARRHTRNVCRAHPATAGPETRCAVRASRGVGSPNARPQLGRLERRAVYPPPRAPRGDHRGVEGPEPASTLGRPRDVERQTRRRRLARH